MLGFPRVGAILLSVAQLSHSQDSPKNITVCVPGQCLEGLSNTTIGATLMVPGQPSTLHLLPGQYSAQSEPQLLRDVITNPEITISPSQGFESWTTLPLNLTLDPGLAIYSGPLYSGTSALTGISSTVLGNTSTPMVGQSLALSNDAIAIISVSNNQLVVWEAIPDFSNLPVSVTGATFSLVNVESLACIPPCSGSGVCATNGTCTCSTGFAGDFCETCAPNFFGPTCQPCPIDCDSCDAGMGGSGRCLKPLAVGLPSTCNCVNGVCGQDGTCVCADGWETGVDGKACSKCTTGFFLTDAGDCARCGAGCDRCDDTTGQCNLCRSGFVRDTADNSGACTQDLQTDTNGLPCPDGSFPTGDTCTPCDATCATCIASPTECATCPRNQAFDLDNKCVTADANGVCPNSALVVDLVKHKCTACGTKCTSCRLPGFNGGAGSVVPLISDRVCTGCIPGFVISGKDCVESCPSGTFPSSSSNGTTPTCTPCSSPCSSCIDSPDFCLTCASNQVASNGTCVASCPSGTFNTPGGTCQPCHPDCATCTGTAFNQCSSCPASIPALSNGRCLSRCSQTQFFDRTTGTCQACDVSCGSCSGSGGANCLSCSGPQDVLRQGRCEAANCVNSTTVVLGLGVCLSELVTADVSNTTSQVNTTVVQIPDALPRPIPSPSESTPATGLNSDSINGTKLPFGLKVGQFIAIISGIIALVLVCCVGCLCFRKRKVKVERRASIYSSQSSKSYKD